jgi:hypothetical protein
MAGVGLRTGRVRYQAAESDTRPELCGICRLPIYLRPGITPTKVRNFETYPQAADEAGLVG